MAKGRASFEIQVSRNNHWTTEDYRETETTARGLAKNILAKHQYQGVRVVKNWVRADGVETATVLFTELAASSLGESLAREISANLHGLTAVGGINALAPAAWPVKDKLLRVTRIYDSIESAAALPDGERKRLVERLDALLSGYLKRERIIEKLDDPSAHLRDRATRLLEFCAARVLPPTSKAQAVARERVVVLLRQPNFEEYFAAGIVNPARREAVLRGLHSLLARGGFRLE